MNKFLFLILLFNISSFDSEWTLKLKKDGIEIYTRSVTGSSFKEFKGITTIEKSNLEEVLAVITDVKNYSKLFPDIENTKILKTEGKNYMVYYMIIHAPWPLKNRDSVYEQKIAIDENGKHAVAVMSPLPDYITEKPDLVRIRKGSGFWELKEDGNNNVKVVYQFHSEPGGEIPSWLANSFVVDHPFETLKNLKSRCRK
jgi:hypothetical protein